LQRDKSREERSRKFLLIGNQEEQELIRTLTGLLQTSYKNGQSYLSSPLNIYKQLGKSNIYSLEI
jgi:hypothetical protein